MNIKIGDLDISVSMYLFSISLSTPRTSWESTAHLATPNFKKKKKRENLQKKMAQKNQCVCGGVSLLSVVFRVCFSPES